MAHQLKAWNVKCKCRYLDLCCCYFLLLLCHSVTSKPCILVPVSPRWHSTPVSLTSIAIHHSASQPQLQHKDHIVCLTIRCLYFQGLLASHCCYFEGKQNTWQKYPTTLSYEYCWRNGHNVHMFTLGLISSVNPKLILLNVLQQCAYILNNLLQIIESLEKFGSVFLFLFIYFFVISPL